jgi:hypothetical protein
MSGAREAVRVHARERHSWSRVAAITERAYRLLAARGTAAAE